MMIRRILSLLFLGCILLSAQSSVDDPVLKARAERAKAQGLADGDLPPVPRGIVEPPPLPPPETHLKDTRGAGRVAKARKHTGSKKSDKSNAKTSKRPAKGGRKSSKRVKA
jgi:hypothetical protein